jgi:hypothetical protein
MTQKEVWLRRLVRRLQFGVFLKSFVDAAVVFCLSVGVLFLAVKLLWPALWPASLYLLLLTIPLTLAAFWISRRAMYSQTQTVAMLDRRIGAGGLLMTLMEQPHDQWEARLPEARQVWLQGLPPIRPVRLLKHLGVPLLFLIAAIILPPRIAQSLTNQPSAISQTQTEQLDQLLKQLAEAEVFAEEESEELQAEIEKLKQETKFSPLTHEDWAAVDMLRESMQVAAESRRNQVTQATSAIASAQAQLANSGELTEKERTELQEKIDALCESGQSGSEGESKPGGRKGQGGKSGKLSDQIAQSDCQGKLGGDAEELKAALNELSEMIESECDRLDGL